MNYFEVLDRIKPVLPAPQAAQPVRQEARSLVVDAKDRTVVTVPVRESALDVESFVTRVRGRLVGAEEANRNGQFWTTGDLVFGVGSVAGGPLNWLHEERHIVGALTEARLVTPTQQASEQASEQAKAAPVSAESRRKMADSGVAMSDGSFPIPDLEHLKSAIRLAHTPAQRAHVIKRAKALGHSDLIPDSWRQSSDDREGASHGWTRQPHIEAAAVMWSYLYPAETATVRQAAGDGQLFYSMECLSKEVECFGPSGCGRVMAYADTVQRNERACAHVRDRSGVRRLINPVFLGAALIVPPTGPGWANANVDVVRRAGASVQLQDFTDGQTELAAQILSFITG